MDKKSIRKSILKERNNIPSTILSNFSSIIAEKLYSTNEYKNAKTIMSFISFDTEVDTHKIIKDSLNLDKRVLVPVTFPDTKLMKPSHLMDFSELEYGYYNILTPKEEFWRFIDPNEIDLILMPGVGFDRKGYRVGYGGGYYDRFLSKLDKKIPTIGLAFNLQIIESVPTDEFDIPIDMIITEKEIIDCNVYK